MCTVTYVPLNNGFVFTSNRDEQTFRPTSDVVSKFIGKQKVSFPQDEKAGGTWVSKSDNKIICLLNGAKEKYVRAIPYRRSRGLVLLDAFEYDSFSSFCDNYEFIGIEPFTMICVEVQKDEIILSELFWNGDITEINILDNKKPCIWSSINLYSTKERNLRERWLERYKGMLIDERTILDFHNGRGDFKEVDLFYQNGEKATVSITQLYSFATKPIQMNYMPLF